MSHDSDESKAPIMGSEFPVFPKHFSLVVLLPTFLALLAVLVTTWRRIAKRKSSAVAAGVPGPRQYFLGGYLNLLQLCNKKKFVNLITGWCLRTRGPVMKLGLGPLEAVLLLTPDYAQKLFGSMRPEHLAKPRAFYNFLKPVDWFDGLFHSTGEKYKSRRKLLNLTYGYASVLRLVPAFNECGKRLVGELDTTFEKSVAYPIELLVREGALATLMKTILGADDEADQDDYRRIEHCVKRSLEILMSRLLKPWLALDSLFRLSPLFKEQREVYEWSLQVINEWVERYQEEKKRGSSRRGRGTRRRRSDEEEEEYSSSFMLKDLLQGGLPPKGIYEEIVTVITAGNETTGNTLHYTLFFLALHPSIQEKARREVDAVFEDEHEGLCDVNGDISEGGVARLEYLEQCVMESLRFFPPALTFGRELGGSLTLDEGLELPAGTNVGVWLPAIHMNPEYYPNPERFDPDRFSPEMRKARHPYSYLPFSAGPRKCPGHKFAMMEIVIVAAHILRNFTFGTPQKFENVVWVYNLTLEPETPIPFVFEKRKF